MAVTVKRLDDFDAHSAPERGISMKLARHGLDVESFGMQVIDMSANCDAHPEHDHAEEGQEEVYVVIEGSATLHVDDEQFPLARHCRPCRPGSKAQDRDRLRSGAIHRAGWCPGQGIRATGVLEAEAGRVARGTMDLGVEGRVALVMGASKGIGYGVAAALAREGAKVAVASRSRELIEAAAERISSEQQEQVRGFVADTGKLESVRALVAEVEQRIGRIEILVTNTGGPALEVRSTSTTRNGSRPIGISCWRR